MCWCSSFLSGVRAYVIALFWGLCVRAFRFEFNGRLACVLFSVVTSM